MTRICALLASFFVVACAIAAPPDAPTAVTVKPGQLYRVTVKTDAEIGTAKNFTDDDAFWGELVGPKGTRQFVFQAPQLEPDGTYKGKSSYVVSWWTKGEIEGVSTTITVVAPTPGPTPGPGPGPGPNPPTPPTPQQENPFGALPGLHVLIVYESETVKDLPTGQYLTLFGKKTRDYLDAKCVKDGYRIYDQNQKGTGSEWWETAMKRTDRKSLPWLYVGKEATGYSGPLEKDADANIAVIGKYAGN